MGSSVARKRLPVALNGVPRLPREASNTAQQRRSTLPRLSQARWDHHPRLPQRQVTELGWFLTGLDSGHDLHILIDFTIHDLLAHGQCGTVKPGLRVVFVELAAHKADQLADGFDHVGAVALVLLDIAEVHVFHAIATAP